MKMNKNKLIGIMMGLIVLIIIPIICVNIDVQATTNPFEEQTLVPQTVYSIPRNTHRYWDFGNIISNTHTIDIDFTSNVGVDSWFMTYDDLLRWEADTPPYTKHNIQYDKTTRTIIQWNPEFNEHWVFVIDNTNLVSASVDFTRSTHRTQVEITGTSFTYYDSDGDGYNDSLTLYFDVTLDRHVIMDFTYEVDFSYKGENMNDNIHEILGDTTWINHERTIDVFLNPNNQIETLVSAKITVEINDATWQGDYDGELTSSTNLYYPNYKREQVIKISLFIGIPVVIIASIVTVAVVVVKKRKASLIKP